MSYLKEQSSAASNKICFHSVRRGEICYKNCISNKYKLAAKCSKNDTGEKHTSTDFVYKFFQTVSTLLHYLLVSSINIVNIQKIIDF